MKEVIHLLRQIKYFQAVVQHHSFSEAAEACHISQSAISQQIKALERELGFQLLERRNRSFSLTTAGAYFYKKSLILLADYERLCRETGKLARGEEAVLKIGCLRHYGGAQLPAALSDFVAAYPKVSVQLRCGNHEELFQWLRNGDVDLVFNDQRRAFSEEYVNLVLAECDLEIEISAHNAIAALPNVNLQALKNMPCILVAAEEQHDMEQAYYQTVVGVRGDFLFAESLEEARLLVASGQGFLPLPAAGQDLSPHAGIRRLPLCRGANAISQKFCLFWKKENSGYYIEAFADILQAAFA